MTIEMESIPDVDNLQRKVLRYVASRSNDGAMCYEVETALGMGHSTVSPRLHELLKKDYLRQGDVQRPTRRGRTAAVWFANYPKATDPLQLVLSGV